MGRTVRWGVRSGVIFGENAGAVVGREDEDSIDGEEGHVRRHVGNAERDGEDSIVFPTGVEYVKYWCNL